VIRQCAEPFINGTKYGMMPYEGEVHVAERHQILSDALHALAVIHPDFGDISARRADIVENDRNRAFRQLGNDVVVHFRDDHGKTGDAASEHHARAGGELL